MLRHGAKDVAVTKALVAGARQDQMIGKLVLDAQAARPAIGQLTCILHDLRLLTIDARSAQSQQKNESHRQAGG